MLSRLFSVLTICLTFFVFQSFAASISWNGTSGVAGNWNDATKWSGGNVPTSTDEVTIDCSCIVTNNTGADLLNEASLTIASGTTLDLNNFKLEIGNTVNTATLTNQGTIQNSPEIKVKGDATVGNGPYLINYGLIDNITKLSVGNNQGGGHLTNITLAIINAVDAHIDGTMLNDGTINISDEFLLHGGVLNGTGSVNADRVTLSDNPQLGAAGENNAGEINGGAFETPGGCSDGGSNTDLVYTVNAVDYTYAELVEAVDNGSITNTVLSLNSSSCGEASYSVLPVDLISFDAHVEQHMVNLSWSTATELNNDYFEVLKSLDGLNFSKVGDVKGNGTVNEFSHYNYTDMLLASHSYYRLKQVDYDGEFELHEIIFVENNEISQSALNIYPNPSTQGIVYIDSHLYNSSQFSITDLQGNLLMNGTVEDNLINTTDLTSGMYLLQLHKTGISNLKYRIVIQ